jgi:hypothetical protein
MMKPGRDFVSIDGQFLIYNFSGFIICQINT